MPVANQLFGFGLIILVMLVGLDFLARSAGPRAHAGYRRMLGRIGRELGRVSRRLWRRHWKFFVGVAVGIMLTVYFSRLP